MKQRIVRIAPWQAGKVSAVLYFILGLVFGLFIALVSLFAKPVPGRPSPPGIGFAIAIPFLYALMGLVLVPFTCWIYNVAAKLVGGLSVTVEDDRSEPAEDGPK